MKKVLGIDIGGTNIRAAVVDPDGNILSRKKVKSNAREGIDKLILNLEEIIAQFSEYETSCIGIGIPGIIDQKNGVLTQAPNIRAVKNFPLFSELGKRPGFNNFIVENDANAAALGEFWKGAGSGSNSMLMITIGTGLGGGIVLNGELWRGEDGMAGEIGHIILDPDGPKCNCGSNGCFESFVSAEAVRHIVNSSKDLKGISADSHLDDIPEQVMKLALEGNQESIKIWDNMGTNLGIGITSLVNLLNVDTVIIGGGLSNAWDLFKSSMNSEIKRRALSGPAERLSVYRAKLGDDAGIMGSAYLAFKNL